MEAIGSCSTVKTGMQMVGECQKAIDTFWCVNEFGIALKLAGNEDGLRAHCRLSPVIGGRCGMDSGRPNASSHSSAMRFS